METGSWQRARSREQIAEREEAILTAASRLFEEKPYEEVTLRSIAAEAGFTRSNVYRYFESREAIFLELYRRDVVTWFADVTAALDVLQPPLPRGHFVDTWSRVLLRQERLLRLTPQLTISLERNPSPDVYREFKRFTRKTIGRAVELVAPFLPDLTAPQIAGFFFVHQALVAGGVPMCRYTPMQEQVLEAAELASLRLEFGEFYRNAVLAYLDGLAHASRTGRPQEG